MLVGTWQKKFLTDKNGDIMKIRRIFTAIFTLVMVISLITSASAATFTDVPENHPYKDAIDFCQTKGFVSGTSSTTFMPDAKLVRGHLAIIWCRSLNIKTENHSFTDVTKLRNSYDSPAIVLRSLGIISGTSETKFSPLSFITREQLAVITMNTYKLGVANQEAYTKYADNATISEWARNGISACINAKVFEGLYDGENFKPKEPVTRAEICKLIYNISLPTHTVTVAPIEGGTIIASPTEARAGTIITLAITPNAGKQLQAGSLKYNAVDITGTTFNMPTEDVTITAVFENKPVVLESISITTPPTKATYIVGEALDLSGMVVTATYSDNTSNAITGYTTTPENGSVLDTAGPISINVSYTEGDVTKTTTFTVQVNAS